MPKASEVASALREMADVLDASPDTDIAKPDLYFYHGHNATKEQFLALARIFPRPFKKSDGYDHTQYRLAYESPVLDATAWIERSKVCTIITPAREAVYDCPALLSPEEEASIA